MQPASLVLLVSNLSFFSDLSEVVDACLSLRFLSFCSIFLHICWDFICVLSVGVNALELESKVLKARLHELMLVVLLLRLLESFLKFSVLGVVNHILVVRTVLTLIGIATTMNKIPGVLFVVVLPLEFRLLRSSAESYLLEV